MTDEIWTRAALKDVVDEWVTGSTPPRTNPEFFVPEGGTPWVKAEDVKGGLLYETAEHLSEAGGRQMRRAQKNAVLVTTTGTIGKVAVAGRCFVIRPFRPCPFARTPSFPSTVATFCSVSNRCCFNWRTAQRSPMYPRESCSLCQSIFLPFRSRRKSSRRCVCLKCCVKRPNRYRGF